MFTKGYLISFYFINIFGKILNLYHVHKSREWKGAHGGSSSPSWVVGRLIPANDLKDE